LNAYLAFKMTRGGLAVFLPDKSGTNSLRPDGWKACSSLPLQVFGIDRSSYMEDCARYRFALEIAETGKLRLDRAPDLRNLPYPSEVFNHILHVDFYYFVHHEIMPYICKELWRVLKPGGTMICGISFDRLKKLSHWGLLEDSQWDPMRYMVCLEPAGFVDVNIEYKSSSQGNQYQMICARKPEINEV
uniref:Methyltransf_11 domain-containing protein n=1 Tax=Angiostrongylus cantonensis TaxID=6313 RepID=A0A0K0DPV6_ANGCA